MIVDTSEHRALHNKDSSGRDSEIEGYVNRSFSFYHNELLLSRRFEKDNYFIDVGADYGYAMKLAEDSSLFSAVFGIEPYPADGMQSVCKSQIWPITWETYINEKMNFLPGGGSIHLFINHVFEHFNNPIEMLQSINSYNTLSRSSKSDGSRIKTLFIAVPDAALAGSDFVFAPGHTHIYNRGWFNHILPRYLNNVKFIKQENVCFRKDYVELWNYIELED